MRPLTNPATGIYFMLLTLLFSASVITVKADNDLYGFISGRVFDYTDSSRNPSRKPVRFALVVVKLNGIIKASSYTDSSGSFRISKLKPGAYVVQCQALGFRGVTTIEVNVKASQTSAVIIRLTHVHLLEKLELDPLEKTPGLQDAGNTGGLGLILFSQPVVMAGLISLKRKIC